MDERILDELQSAGMYAHAVIDLASVRVARGTLKRGVTKCEHRSVVYSTTERRIECDDCNQVVDPFDAFMVITKHFDDMLGEVRLKEHRAADAMKSTLHRRAAKALERSWSKMAPCCPHCRGGLLPEDFENGPRAAIGRDLEIARRKRERDKPVPFPEPPHE